MIPLVCRNVSVRYGARLAVDTVSLELQPGELVGLIGPNGCGKSSLLGALTGLLPLASGSVHIAGQPLSALSRSAFAQHAAVVPQRTDTLFAFTAAEVIEMARYWNPAALPAATAQAADTADVRHLLHRPITQLSGGELQRVILARALAQNTPILLLDEPAAHLDLGHQIAAYQLLVRLAHHDRKTILCASHDLAFAAEFFDRLLLMHHGRVAASGSPRDVLTTANLESIYCARVHVQTNPRSGRPLLVLDAAAPAAPENPTPPVP